MDLSKIVQEIQYVLAPAVMISSSALLLLGFQNKFSSLANRFRALNQERRTLSQKLDRNNPENERLRNLKAQVDHLIQRAAHVKNAILLMYVAIMCFVATSIFLFLNIYMHFQFSYLAIMFFLIGLVLVFVVSASIMIEVALSFKVLDLESKL